MARDAKKLTNKTKRETDEMTQVVEYLHSKGVKPRIKKDQAHMECPECLRNDGRFSINIETGLYSCLHGSCGIKGTFTEFRRIYGDGPMHLAKSTVEPKPKVYVRPKVKIGPVTKSVAEYLEGRGISEFVQDLFQLGSQGDDTILFPYYKDGELYGVKHRTLGKRIWSENDEEPSLYGRDRIEGNTLIICEGEIDAMTMFNYGRNAVSCNRGAKNLDWLDTEKDFLSSFDEIFLCFDMDEAGRTAVEMIANKLGSGRCKDVRLPYKDANECWQNGVTTMEIDECFMKAEAVVFDEPVAKVEDGKRDIRGEVRDMVENEIDGVFYTANIKKDLNITTREEGQKLSRALAHLVEKNIITRHSGKDGCFRKIDSSIEVLDPWNADPTPVPIVLPLGLNEHATIYTRNVIVIAGESNSGKTALCLEMADLNKDKFNINYMSSEMDEPELLIRLTRMGAKQSDWEKVQFQFRFDNFQDKLDQDGLNIIDYLDEGMGEDSSAVNMAKRITEISNSIKRGRKGIVVIVIQKMKGKEFGYGGAGTISRSRLYVTVTAGEEYGRRIMKIIKTKNPGESGTDSKDMELDFTLTAGCQFKKVGDWHRTPGDGK